MWVKWWSTSDWGKKSHIYLFQALSTEQQLYCIKLQECEACLITSTTYLCMQFHHYLFKGVKMLDDTLLDFGFLMSVETCFLTFFNDLSSSFFTKKKKNNFGSFWGEKGKKCVFEVWNCWNVGLKKEWITMWVNSRWLLMWVKSRWFYLGLFSEVWVAMRKIVWKKSNFQYYIWQHRYMCFSSWIGKHEGHISLGLKRI